MENKNFEEALKELEAYTNKITQEDITLDESIKCYEEGMKRYKQCTEILNKAKQQIEYYEGE